MQQPGASSGFVLHEWGHCAALSTGPHIPCSCQVASHLGTAGCLEHTAVTHTLDSGSALNPEPSTLNPEPGALVQVFRTYNASIVLDALLWKAADMEETPDEKKADYDRANKEVPPEPPTLRRRASTAAAGAFGWVPLRMRELAWATGSQFGQACCDCQLIRMQRTEMTAEFVWWRSSKFGRRSPH